jgi:hypothetical protein
VHPGGPQVGVVGRLEPGELTIKLNEAGAGHGNFLPHRSGHESFR